MLSEIKFIFIINYENWALLLPDFNPRYSRKLISLKRQILTSRRYCDRLTIQASIYTRYYRQPPMQRFYESGGNGRAWSPSITRTPREACASVSELLAFLDDIGTYNHQPSHKKGQDQRSSSHQISSKYLGLARALQKRLHNRKCSVEFQIKRHPFERSWHVLMNLTQKHRTRQW